MRTKYKIQVARDARTNSYRLEILTGLVTVLASGEGGKRRVRVGEWLTEDEVTHLAADPSFTVVVRPDGE